MIKLKTLMSICLAVVTATALVGCGAKKDDTASSKNETRVVQTTKGEVTIPKEPKKIVDISGSSEELVLLGHTPVGTANVDSYKTDSVPSYVQDKLGQAKVVGHSMMDTMDVEAILAQQPDLIIMAPRQEKIYDQLKEIAPVVMLKDEANDWGAKLKDVASLFGQESDAEKWLNDYYASAKKVGEDVKAANGEQTYLTVLAYNGSFMVFSEGGIGTMLKDDLKLPQPKNMPKQDGITLPTVTVEGLTQIDADHIVVIGTDADKADLEKNSVWKAMRAVKEGHVTFLNASPYFSQAYNPIGRQLLLPELKSELTK